MGNLTKNILGPGVGAVDCKTLIKNTNKPMALFKVKGPWDYCRTNKIFAKNGDHFILSAIYNNEHLTWSARLVE